MEVRMDALDNIREAYLKAMAKLAEGIAQGFHNTDEFMAFLKAKEAFMIALEEANNATNS